MLLMIVKENIVLWDSMYINANFLKIYIAMVYL